MADIALRGNRLTAAKGGRISKQLGGVGNTQPITGAQRFDQSRGYYQPDMGMRGGAMYNKGGRAGFKHGDKVERKKKFEKKKVTVDPTKAFKPKYKRDSNLLPPVPRELKATLKGIKKGRDPGREPRGTTRKWIRATPTLAAEGGRIGFKKGTDKNWIQKVNKSIKKRGTKGKCTPITKKGCTGRAKALAKTFKKIAAKRKA